jgi:hypothetical protein
MISVKENFKTYKTYCCDVKNTGPGKCNIIREEQIASY